MMRTIGAISDTHGLLRPQALAALAGCDPIIHAGDVGSPDVLARLGALAPLHAVRGNVDHGAWSANLPVTQRIEIDGFRIYVLHILAELDPQAADKVDAVRAEPQPTRRLVARHEFAYCRNIWQQVRASHRGHRQGS